MRFLVDESTGAAVIQYLRDSGHDALAVAEIMPQAQDADILAEAARDARILITNDKDFGELIYRTGQPHSGVLLLRLQGESALDRVRVIRTVLEQHASRLPGAFAVATERHVRIRPARQRP